ncbi:TenA family protein [Haladaptatus sp. NG-SE-30]
MTAPASFEEYAVNRENPRFSEWLRERSEPAWNDATRHRFIDELGADELEDEVFRRYLVQDYAFLETAASVTGYAVGQAPTMAAKARLADALTMLTGGEDEYFQRSFDALSVPEELRNDPPLSTTTKEFQNLLLRAAHEGDYEETLAVILAAELVYLAWAIRIEEQSISRWYLDEWVQIHATADFEGYVEWLRDQIDQCGLKLSPRRQQRVADLFQQTVELEVAFFDAAYEKRPSAAEV